MLIRPRNVRIICCVVICAERKNTLSVLNKVAVRVFLLFEDCTAKKRIVIEIHSIVKVFSSEIWYASGRKHIEEKPPWKEKIS